MIVQNLLDPKVTAFLVRLYPKTRKDTFMQMLLHLNDDFDDDLLLDALRY